MYMPIKHMKNTTRRKRRRKSVFNTAHIEESKQVSSLSEFFVLMQYETDSPAAYCGVLSKCRRQETPGLGTMAVTINKDGSFALLYDPIFNDLVKDRNNWDTVRMIIVHEFIHLQDEHVKRTIELYKREQDKDLFGRLNPLAVDFACNSTGIKWELYTEHQLLSGHPYMELSPGEPLKDDKGRIVGQWRGVLPTEEPWCLPSNLSYERYYKILKDMEKGKKPKQWKKELGNPKSGQDQDGSGGSDKGKVTEEDLDQRLKECQDLLRKREGKKRYIHIEDLDLSELTEEDIETIVQESERISQEVNNELLSELKSRGLGAGKLASHIESKLTPPQIPWEQFLRNFVRNASLKKNKKKSIRSQNKRREDNGIWSPFPGKEKDRKVKLLVAIDTSGSVSEAEFIEMRNEILALHSLLSDITVIYCDSQIANIEKLTQHSKLPDKMWGRGGTSFDPPFQWAIENSFKPDIIIYGTDGYCTMPPAHLRIKVPVLWLVSSNGGMPGSWYSNGSDFKPGKLYDCEYGKALKLNPLK